MAFADDQVAGSMFLPLIDQAPLGWARVAEHLASNGLEISLDTQPRQFSSGAANMNFLITLDGRKAVLRRPPDGLLPPGANDIAREYRVLSSLWKVYPYAPRALHYCSDTHVIGVPFCISEFRDGITIGDTLPDSLSDVPNIGKRLGKITIDALIRLHSISPEAAGLEDIGRPDGYIERQVRGWAKRGALVFSDTAKSAHKEVCDWLMQSIPAYLPTSIVHNDFKLDNLLIDPDTLELKGVVDWDMCTIGNPLLELSILLLYWGECVDQSPYSDIARMPYNTMGWISRREVIDIYSQRTPFDLNETDLTFYVVLALSRMAVVYAQLLDLYQRGVMKSAVFDEKERREAFVNMDRALQECRRLMSGKLPW